MLSYMEEVLPEKKELDTEIVLDTMINEKKQLICFHVCILNWKGIM